MVAALILSCLNHHSPLELGMMAWVWGQLSQHGRRFLQHTGSALALDPGILMGIMKQRAWELLTPKQGDECPMHRRACRPGLLVLHLDRLRPGLQCDM
jgi:hypothetical protein